MMCIVTCVSVCIARLILSLKCLSLPEWLDTPVHCLSEGAHSDSGMFDCSKGRCQPSDKGTFSTCNGQVLQVRCRISVVVAVSVDLHRSVGSRVSRGFVLLASQKFYTPISYTFLSSLPFAKSLIACCHWKSPLSKQVQLHLHILLVHGESVDECGTCM